MPSGPAVSALLRQAEKKANKVSYVKCYSSSEAMSNLVHFFFLSRSVAVCLTLSRVPQ